ncbi:MAG: AAA family ATPase [Chlamydiales bacterium]
MIRKSSRRGLILFFIFQLTPLYLSSQEIPIEILPDHQNNFYVNHHFIDESLIRTEERYQLFASLKQEYSSSDDAFLYKIKKISESGKYLTLEDDSIWLIRWWDREIVENWQPQNSLKLTYQIGYSNKIQFENIDHGDCAWGINEHISTTTSCLCILKLLNSVFTSNDESTLVLNNGLVFKGPRVNWKVRDRIFVFHSPSKEEHVLWNLTRNQTEPWQLIGNEKKGDVKSIFHLEESLNNYVLGQNEVIHTLSALLLNYAIGLKNPDLPIGVFLFIGPTGVGKTELAKTLAKVLYHNSNCLLRFDMSQFISSSDVTRLIGSPPGYVNHEEGGQFTEALKAYPQSIVLLDEIEKAHPHIQKVFIPVFDEGYIIDKKNTFIPCNKIIFIMTANLCSQKIADLFHQGYSSEKIIEIIEPELMAHLSPELYNRMTTFLFRPISHNLMERLVKQKLDQVIQQFQDRQHLTLVIDDSVYKYLIEKGHHPKLGVRALKRMIEQKIISFLAYAIIQEGIPEGSILDLSYVKKNDSWHLNWEME